MPPEVSFPVERIEVRGLRHLQENYVRDRLQLRTDPPLTQADLEEALQLLQLDPNIA